MKPYKAIEPGPGGLSWAALRINSTQGPQDQVLSSCSGSSLICAPGGIGGSAISARDTTTPVAEWTV